MKWHGYGCMVYTERAEMAAVSSFMWHQPCQRCKYTTSVDIQKRAIKAINSCRSTCERGESAREQRIALYKSDQQQHFYFSWHCNCYKYKTLYDYSTRGAIPFHTFQTQCLKPNTMDKDISLFKAIVLRTNYFTASDVILLWLLSNLCSDFISISNNTFLHKKMYILEMFLKHVHLMEVMYFVCTHMPGKSYRRQFRSLFCTYDVFQTLLPADFKSEGLSSLCESTCYSLHGWLCVR